MSIRLFLALAAGAAALTGCQEAPERQPTNDPAAQPSAAAPERGASKDATTNIAETQPGALPPPTALRFVGLWAADARKCSTEAWRFTDTSLSTPAGSHCTFSKVTQVPGGYDIAASCTAEAPPKDETIRIRFAQSAQAMLFESDAIADAGLVYCGREG